MESSLNLEAVDVEDGVTEFVFQKQRSVFLQAGKECRIGFFLSDGASVTVFQRSKGLTQSNDFHGVEWSFLKNGNLTKSGNGYNWSPLFRLLC